jgi:tetratricopeptide (TPR) repeat protein
MMYHWEPSLSPTAKDELRPYVERDWARVVATYQRKLDANPNDAEAAFRLGVAQTELQQHARAIVTLERALALGVRDPDALDELGDSQAALGHYEEAARIYERELPLRWSQAQPYIAVNAAKAWARAGDKDAAIAILQRWAPKLDGGALRDVPELASLRGDPRFDALAGKTP